MSVLRYAVFGQPVAHSLSPRIHAMFAAQFGRRVDYRAIEVAPGALGAALEAFAARGGRGANVTLPLKEEAVGLCASLGQAAVRAAAVNLLRLDARGWHGDNTDGIGLVRDLRERHGLSLDGAEVWLLGAGGAARGVIPALLDAGIAALTIINRSRPRAEALVGRFGARCQALPLDLGALAERAPPGLLLNALSSGHAGLFPLPVAPGWLHATLAYDLSYGAAARPFVAWARACGAAAVETGLGMLVEQAAESWWLWNRERPVTATVLAALQQGLDC